MLAGALSISCVLLLTRVVVPRVRLVSWCSWDISSLGQDGILEELPVSIRNSKLVEAFLSVWVPRKDVDCDFRKLELPSQLRLERSLRVLKDEVCVVDCVA